MIAESDSWAANTGAQLNEFLTRTAPWSLVKSEKPEAKAEAELVLFTVAESLRVCGILLQPFLPDKAAQLLDTLGVAQDRRTYAHAVPRCDFTYGAPFVDPGRDRHDGLFPPLIEDLDVNFGPTPRASNEVLEIVQSED